MNCMQIKGGMGYDCTPLKDGVHFMNTPFTLGYDPETIGAYILDEGNGEAYVTDDGVQLFTAQTHGVSITKRRIKKLGDMLAAYGLSITTGWEVAGRCRSEEIGSFLSRYLEASIRLSDEIWEMFPGAPKSFEERVGEALDQAMPRRVSRNISFTGASGHQLTFPFVIDFATENQKIIQPISSRGQDPRWSTVMQTLGKLVDLKEVQHNAKTFVVLEPGANAEGARHARAALVRHATIIALSDPASLKRSLAA